MVLLTPLRCRQPLNYDRRLFNVSQWKLQFALSTGTDLAAKADTGGALCRGECGLPPDTSGKHWAQGDING